MPEEKVEAVKGLSLTADICILYQCEPPRDVEAYIHRSGRTGRAGISTGFAIGLLWDCDIGVIDLRLYCGFVFIQVILGLLSCFMIQKDLTYLE